MIGDCAKAGAAFLSVDEYSVYPNAAEPHVTGTYKGLQGTPAIFSA
jgi:hypothetical protein